MSNNNHPTFGDGKICYIEIPAIDINTSAVFYDKTFGWMIRRRNDGSVSFDDAVGEVSGMWVLGRKPANEQGLIISIMVYNIQATMDLIADNGGKILAADIEGKEKTASFSDPAGNVFGLYQHHNE